MAIRSSSSLYPMSSQFRDIRTPETGRAIGWRNGGSRRKLIRARAKTGILSMICRLAILGRPLMTLKAVPPGEIPAGNFAEDTRRSAETPTRGPHNACACFLRFSQVERYQ